MTSVTPDVTPGVKLGLILSLLVVPILTSYVPVDVIVSSVPLKLFVNADAVFVIVTTIFEPVFVQTRTLSAADARFIETVPDAVVAVVI